MSTSGRSGSPRPHHRGQAGFTLLEVMLTVVVSSMIAVPLLAWMLMGTKTQTRVQRTSTAISSRNLVSTYLPKDMASSVSVQLGGTDCTGGSGSGGVALLSLTTSNAPVERVVYVVAPPVSPSLGTAVAVTDRSVWRRVCGEDGNTTDATMLVADAVAPSGGWTSAVACADRAGRTGDPCGQVTVSFSLRDAGVVRATAVRRVGGPQ